MSGPVQGEGRQVGLLRRQLAEYASVADSLALLAQEGDEPELLASLFDVIDQLCAPGAVGFVPTGDGVPGTATARPGTFPVDEIVRHSNGIPVGQEWYQFTNGFAVRIGSTERPLGVLVAVDVPFPEQLDDHINLVLAIRAVVAMAITSVRTRHDLAVREARYRMLAENSSDVVYLSGPDQVLTWVAPGVELALGWAPEELVGTVMADLLHPEDRRATDERRAGVYSGLDVISQASGGALVRVRTRDGGYRWFMASGTPYSVQPGEIAGVVGAMRDVDELVRAREESQAERLRLRATMDALFDPCVYLEAIRDEGGTIIDFLYVDANDAACAYNHHSREDMIGARLLDVLPGHRAVGLLETYAEIVDTGVPYVVDGQSYFNEILGEELLSDVRGIRVGDGLSLTWREVTDRYRAAEALAESEERYRLLAERSSDVVYLAGPDRRIRWIAPSVSRVLGWSVDEMIGRQALEFVYPEDAPAIAGVRDAVYSGQIPPDDAHVEGVVARVMTKSGEVRWMVSSNSAKYDESGALTSVVGSMRDVDDLVRAREQAQMERGRLEATMDSLLDPHVFFRAVRDDAGRIVDFAFTDVNRAARRYLQLEQRDVIGTRLLDMLPEITGNGVFTSLVQTVETDEPLRADNVRYSNDRMPAERWFDIRGIRVGDGLSFLWRDVTARFDAARALADSEERYRLVAENSSDVVYLTGPDRKVRWIAPSVTGTLGWDPEEIVGTEAINLVHPEDRRKIMASREDVYTGRGVRHRGGRNGLLLRILCKSGEYHWIVGFNIPLYDDSGALTGVAGSMRDVNDLVNAREQAQGERARLEATLDSLLDPHVFLQAVRDETDAIVDFVYADANAAACEYMRMSRSRLVGARLLDLLPGQAGSGMLAMYALAVDTGNPLVLDDYQYPHEVLREDRRYDIRAIRVNDGLSFTWRDVTDRFAAQRQLAESEARYRLLADNSTDVIAQLREGLFVWVSTSIRASLGWDPADLIGHPSLDFVHPDDHARVLAGRVMLESGRTARRRYRLRGKGGGYHWVDAQGGPMYREDGVLDGSILSIRIVDAEVQAQEALEFRAQQDMLTGLVNREEALQRLSTILGRSTRTGEEIAVVFCDFDDFKTVNDTFGHAGGDHLLRTVSDRVRAAVRNGDLVARIGGDELLVVLDGVHDIQEASAIAEKLRKVVLLPVEVAGGSISTTMSLGVTLAVSGESLDDVIARADAAMYRAKRLGRDQVVAIEIGG